MADRRRRARRTTRDWPEGTSFYHYDKIYDRRNVGYRGPKLRLRLDARPVRPARRCSGSSSRKPHRRPLFAEIDLGVEPHALDPHPAADRLEPTSATARSSTGCRSTRSRLFSDTDSRGLRQSIEYTMSALVLVRAALRRQEPRAHRARRPPAVAGRHRQTPATTCRSRSSPTTRRCCARSPAGAGWTACARARRRRSGRMSAFRDRFLSAFGS